MRSDYINDGYTEEGFIAAVNTPLRLHGELRFTYRPFTVEDRSQLTYGLRNVAPHLHNRKYAIEAAKKLVAWSLRDASDKPVEIKPETVYLIHPALFDRLIDILLGYKGSDIDPLWAESKKDEAVEDQFASALTGTAIGQLTEEANEKN